jgi:hypothetical protein
MFEHIRLLMTLFKLQKLFIVSVDVLTCMYKYRPEFEPLELWRKGPFEDSLRGLPVSISEPWPALKLLAPTEEQWLIGEDEMAAWLHYPIDMPDARTDLNRQTRDESSNSLPSVVLGKEAKSDCQVGPVEINSMHITKAGALALQRGVEDKDDAQSGSEAQNEVC